MIGRCLECGGELQNNESPVSAKCSKCGIEEDTYIVCKEGHYLCNSCASKESISKIFQNMFACKSENPADVAEELIAKCGVSGNSPHPLTTAAFLIAYKNFTKKINEIEIMNAVMRAAEVPGGWCGYYGTCGAAVGLGVAFAEILKSNPMSDSERSISNMVTAEALKQIADLGGPRCCTSSVRAALESGIESAEKYLGIIFPEKKKNYVKCWMSDFNNDCRKKRCRFYEIKNM